MKEYFSVVKFWHLVLVFIVSAAGQSVAQAMMPVEDRLFSFVAIFVIVTLMMPTVVRMFSKRK